VIKVLIVDDSTTSRKMIRTILETSPDIAVVGEAVDGVEGVAMTTQLKPDVITMDVNMPNMNGFEATRQIMGLAPTPIVVMTTLTMQEMVRDGLNILLAGALEIVQKPSTLTDRSYEAVAEELITKVIAVSQIKMNRA
jgi:two-component system, chemotaxis family, protein-glutamate methylesterase/glutaminase